MVKKKNWRFSGKTERSAEVYKSLSRDLPEAVCFFHGTPLVKPTIKMNGEVKNSFVFIYLIGVLHCVKDISLKKTPASVIMGGSRGSALELTMTTLVRGFRVDYEIIIT